MIKKIIDNVGEMGLPLSTNGTIKQDVRNAIRNQMLNAILNSIPDTVNAVKGRCTKGVLLAIENEKGYIPIYIDIKISKMWDSENEYFDPLVEFEDYQEKQQKVKDRKKTQINYKKVK